MNTTERKKIDTPTQAKTCTTQRSEFINFAEVKRLLGIGDKLTRKLIRQGRIPVIRVGPRKCLFERQSVIDAVKSLQEGGHNV